MVWDGCGCSMFPYCSPVPTVIRLPSVAVIKAPLGRPQNITGLMQGSIPHDNHNCEMRTMPRGGPVTRTTPEAHIVTTPSWRSQRVPKPHRNGLRHGSRQRCGTRQAAFLVAYGKTTSVAAAPKAAGIKPAQHYRWLAASAAYWERFRELQEDLILRLQDKAVELPMEGREEPVHYRGQV
jgi:hypothetical protein